MKNELEADSIFKNFSDFEVLRGAFLKCETDNVIGLMGKNGSGKTTLLEIIYGTINTINKNIRINGKRYKHPYKKGNLIAYLPQHRFLPERLTLEKIINIYIKDEASRIRIINDDNITPYLNNKASELSRGELRYFEILLLVNTEVMFIFLDEPFLGLDPKTKENVKRLIFEYRKTKGFVITDHDYRNIVETSDKIVLLSNGTCRYIKSLKELECYNFIPKGTIR